MVIGASELRLEKAISDLQWIHEQIRFSERANCFRPGMISVVGFFAILAGVLQPYVASQTMNEPWSFFVYWVSIACLILVIVGLQIGWRYCFHAGDRERWQARQSILDFSPCIMVGGVFSMALMLSAPEHASLLPAFWSSCFALGIFSTRHRLPESMLIAAGFYVLASIVCLRVATSGSPFTPWTVSMTFGIGHFLTAGILYRYERNKHAVSE
jgi:hypothetical protein